MGRRAKDSLSILKMLHIQLISVVAYPTIRIRRWVLLIIDEISSQETAA